MESARFLGIAPKEILASNDEDFRAVMLAPRPKDILLLGAAVFAALMVLPVLINNADEFRSAWKSDYEFCTKHMAEIWVINSPCHGVLGEIETNHIGTEEDYVKFKFHEQEINPIGADNLVRTLGVAILALAIVLAALKKANPLFMTNIGSEVTINANGTNLVSATIAGKTSGKPWLGSGGLMIRKTRNGDCIVNFYSFDPVAARHGVNEPEPSVQVMIMKKEQSEAFMDYLQKFDNIKAYVTEYNEILIEIR